MFDFIFEAHFLYLFLGERNRFTLRTYETRNAARVGEQIPHIVGINHLDEYVTRQNLSLNDLFLTVGFFFYGFFRGNFYIEYRIGKIVVLYEFFYRIFYERFITRVRVYYVPIRRFGICHF